MISQFLIKRARIAVGAANTYLRRGRNYDDTKWWDRSFYTEGLSDRQTISRDKSAISARYHYASVEMQILRHLRNRRVNVVGARVLDVGAGSGHWIDFYRSLGAAEVVAMDVSRSSFEYLEQKYAGVDEVQIYCGKALEVASRLDGAFQLVNAVGVMFHIVDDAEWAATIEAIGKLVAPGGRLVVGGHFGYLDGLNVQVDRDGQINKRLRSKWRWCRQLEAAGFAKVDVYRNSAYLWIRDHLPENNVLVATR